MSKHTPGPWSMFATPNDPDFTHEITGPNGGIAAVFAGNENAESDAILMHAAQDLLEALQKIVVRTGENSYCMGADVLAIAQPAIAKATSEREG